MQIENIQQELAAALTLIDPKIIIAMDATAALGITINCTFPSMQAMIDRYRDRGDFELTKEQESDQSAFYSLKLTDNARLVAWDLSALEV